MTIWDAPITTPFGQVAGYPLNNGFHNGIDYGAPVGTPITVNGVTIGLSGNTGASTGPHCHVGHWRGGQVLDPGVQGGKTINGAVVTEIGQDSTNGKYIRVGDADGTSWVFLHASDNSKVSIGQELKGGDMGSHTDAEFDALKNDRDAYAEDWARQYYVLGGANPDTVTQADRRARLGLTWEQATADLTRDFPIPPNTSPYELTKQLDASTGKFKPYSGPDLFEKA